MRSWAIRRQPRSTIRCRGPRQHERSSRPGVGCRCARPPPGSPRTGVRQLRVAGHDYDENRPSRLHLSNARSWSEEWGPPPSVHELDGNGNAYDRHMECVESGRRREDVAPVHWRVHPAGLHRWRPGLSTERQRPVRPDDIVRAAHEVDVPVELVGATGVAGRATAHVRRALANREGERLD